MSVPAKRLPEWLAVRLCVLTGVIVLSATLMASGLEPVFAVAITLIASAGAVEIACRLTSPVGSLRIRACVVLVIFVYVLILHAASYPPVLASAIALSSAAIAAQIAGRLTEARHKPFRLVN